MAAMELVIRSGCPKAVKALLDPMSEPKAIEELKKTYGGETGEEGDYKYGEDEHGLLQGTTPILHAARSGQRAMFSAVRDAMKARQVALPLSGDSRNRTVLLLAARSGSNDTFTAVVDALKEDLAKDEVHEMLKNTSGPLGESLAATAARHGDIEFFRVVVGCLNENLTSVEVHELLKITSIPLDESLAVMAASNGDIEFFRGVVGCLKENLTSVEVNEMLKNTSGPRDESLAVMVASNGDIEFFRGVVGCLKEHLTNVEMQDMFMADSQFQDPLLVVAARREDMDLVRGIIVCLREHLTSEQVQELFLGKDEARGQPLAKLMRRFNNEMFTVVIGFLPEVITSEQVRELALTKVDGKCLLVSAFERKDFVSLREVLTCFNDAGPWEDNQAAKRLNLDAMFSKLAKLSLPPGDEFRCVAMEVLSYFLANYAKPKPDDLIKLSSYARQASDERFKDCCMRGVTSAANPFISGMVISTALLGAAERAPEVEKAVLTSLQKNVDNLLLEIFERLPQTVGGFDGGMDGCSAVFKSEWRRSTDTRTGTPGPLKLALGERQQRQTFCNVPLVMDFLSRTFSHGLPDVRDTSDVLSNRDELKELHRGSKTVRLIVGRSDAEKIDTERLIHPDLVDNDDNSAWEHFTLLGRGSILASLMSPGALLQGANDRFPSLTFLPGAQFISAGLAAKPSHYYRVPAMRMVLDFVVYLGVLAVFFSVVLYPEDDGLTLGDYALMVYAVAACLRKLHDVSRDIYYFDNSWNVLDTLGLVLLSTGAYIRGLDSGSQWGQTIYSLSAPLLFSRVLFFAQIFRVQGLMTQVVFSAVLAQFGIVMVVVIMGFAVSFHALLLKSDSFGETLLNLFKAMLGEVGFFDEFSGGQNDPVATVLLVAYVIIVTVMLFNLLVAILSTSYANEQENAEREFRMSKTRLIQYYRSVVHEHLLPAPFNLVQLVVSRLFVVFVVVGGGRGWNTGTRAIEVVGQVTFWLMLGPIAVTQGALLWMTSAFYSTDVWRKHYYESTKVAKLHAREHGDLVRRSLLDEESCRSWMFMYLAQFCSFTWCLVGAPLYLFALWLRFPSVFRFFVRAVHRVRIPIIDSNSSPGTPPVAPTENGIPTEAERLTVDQMLKGAAGGVGADDLRRYLDDPMVDDAVREDDRKRGATVEHVKLLRNRLDMQLKDLSNECLENKQQIAENNNKLNEVLSILKANQNPPAESAT